MPQNVADLDKSDYIYQCFNKFSSQLWLVIVALWHGSFLRRVWRGSIHAISSPCPFSVPPSVHTCFLLVVRVVKALSTALHVAPLGPLVLNYQCAEHRAFWNLLPRTSKWVPGGSTKRCESKNPLWTRTRWQGNVDNTGQVRETYREGRVREAKKGTFCPFFSLGDLRAELEDSRSFSVLSHYMTLYNLQSLQRCRTKSYEVLWGKHCQF